MSKNTFPTTSAPPKIFHLNHFELSSLPEHSCDSSCEITVILAVYNVATFLPTCLNSILNQSHTKFEVILIDDASIDSSSSIADDYAWIDRRISVYHLAHNQGLLFVRKLGTMLCNTQYCCYLDGDDFLSSSNSLDIMLKSIKKERVDILHFSTDLVWMSTAERDTNLIQSITTWCKPYLRSLYGTEILTACFEKRQYGWTMWNKVYKVSLCKAAYLHLSGNLTLGEDIVAFFAIAFYAKSYKGVQTPPLYTYRIGSGISTKQPTLDSFTNSFRSECMVLSILQHFLLRNNAKTQYSKVIDTLSNKFLQNQLSRYYQLMHDEADTALKLLQDHYGPAVVSAYRRVKQ